MNAIVLKGVTQAAARDTWLDSTALSSDVRDKLHGDVGTTCRYSSPEDSIKTYSSRLTAEAPCATQTTQTVVLVSSLARAQDGDESQGCTAEATELLQQKLAAAQAENQMLRHALGSSEQRAAAYKGLVKRASREMDRLEYYKTQAHLASGRADVFLQARATLVKQHKKELIAARSSTQLAVQRVLQLEKQVEHLQQHLQHQQHQHQQDSATSPAGPSITAAAAHHLAAPVLTEAVFVPALQLKARPY